MITLLFLPLILINKSFAFNPTEQNHSNRILILVPGTMNSMVPGPPEQYLDPSEEITPYYSTAIINNLKKQFYAVRVTPNLDYFGDIKKNGQRVYNDTETWYNQVTENMPNKPELWLFGHSAGGLYSLYAAHLNNKYGNILPIKKITMLSTPLKGIEFIDKISQLPFIFESLTKHILNSSWPVDLRGLWDLKTENVNTFLNELTLEPSIQLDAFTGTQNSPHDVCDIFNSHFLSPPLTTLQKIINRLSDGIVSKRSALTDPYISTTDGTELRIKSHPEFILPLDHIEQVWDYRYLRALGTTSSEYVLNKQIESYQTIFSIISTQ
jgi:hypothetical protein